MSLWNRILARVAPNWHYRMTCPDTIESAAQDFIENHLPPLDELQAINFDEIHDGAPWFDWRRRICWIYGVSTCYAHPRGEVAKPGWNRRLWRNNPDADPEKLVDQIFDIMIERVRTISQGTRHKHAVNRSGEVGRS